MIRTIARTAQGEVQGREKDGVLLFAGIPYAAPPTGARRFRAPEPYAIHAARRVLELTPREWKHLGQDSGAQAAVCEGR